MNSRVRGVFASLTALLALCAAVVAESHEFKLDSLISAFVKIEPAEAHLVVRAPLFLFKSVRFPVKGAELDVANSAAAMERALAGLQQGLTLYENGQPLKPTRVGGRLSLPSDRSFDSFERAAAHVAEPIEPDTAIMVDQGYVDAHFVFPLAAAGAVYAVRTTVAPELGDYLKLALRYLPLAGDGRAMVITGSAGAVDLNPTWIGAAAGFAGLGVSHIVTGFDHLLFLLCLVIPLRGLRPILAVITAFTLAHSFTLIGSAFGLTPQGAWFAPFVEMMIAVSIVYSALENIIGVTLRRRVGLAFLFGLVHGFGFSYGLQQELQFAGSHLLVSLFAFNLGIEFGQLMVLALMLPMLWVLRRYVLPGRSGYIILSAILAHVGWHWMTDRWDALANVRWPAPQWSNLPLLALWVAGLALALTAIVKVLARLRLESTAPARNGGNDIRAGPLAAD